ncbi:hypothetical protein SAMN05428949_0158 [Chitinophaga sp. YR627]|nr:hypothetical protein SAMN05428949_0158 [Chitinophaga sp. YR627]
MKEVYTCSAHDESIIMIYDQDPLFDAVSDILEDTYGIEKEKFGTSDIMLKGDEVSLMKLPLEQLMKEKLAVHVPIGESNQRVTVFGQQYALNTRDDEHMTIYSLKMLLDMIEAEIAAGGPVWFYNIAFANETDPYILGVIKPAEDGITADAAFAQFRESEEALTADQFKERLQALKIQGFINDRKAGEDDPLLYPSEKTLKVQTI